MNLHDHIRDPLVRALLKNQQRDRFWRNTRFILWILVVGFGVFLGWHHFPGKRAMPNQPYVAMVRLNGVITSDADFSAEKVLPQLERAFADKNARGVVLEINSGGGSPVQASIIEEKIIELKQRFHKKVVVVGEDVLASGAYLVAMGADEIYVNADTIAGSIGVVMEGFGFHEAIKKLGVSRRVYTAGSHKDRLDPFEPVSTKDQQKIQALLDEAHDHFVEIVKKSRGDRLHGDPAELFSGDFWLGSSALKLGLVDGLGNLSEVTHTIFQANQYIDYSEEPSLLTHLLKGMRSELHILLSEQHATLTASV